MKMLRCNVAYARYESRHERVAALLCLGLHSCGMLCGIGHRLAAGYWHFMADYQFHLQGSSRPTAWSLKRGLLGSSETSVTSCQPVLWIPDEW